MTTTPAPEPAGKTDREPATVLLVDDSTVQRRFLRGALESADFTVVGEARNGREAVAMVERLRPAAVLMDLDLPIMNGIEAIERIMATRPTPIVVYSAFVDGENSTNAIEALAAGAVDVVAKPEWGEGGRLEEYADDLRRRVRVASRVKVITHPRGRLKRTAPALARVERVHDGPVEAAPPDAPNGNGVPAAAATTAATTNATTATTATTTEAPTAARTGGALVADAAFGAVAAPPRPLTAPQREAALRRARAAETARGPVNVQLVAIGASTGGPQALATLLGALPPDFAPAVLVVQHMAEGFIPGLVAWLDHLCALPVVMGETGRRLAPGTVTVAPSGLNLLVHDYLRVVCEPAPERQFHVPGIDASFESIAASIGADAVGVLLTGMGRDGAAGLKRLRDRGAVTIGQDEATSAVYGMPQAAYALGAVEHQLALPDIAPLLLDLAAGEDRP